MTTKLPLRTKSDDLWELAVASLNDETRSNVDFTCTDKLSILSELHTATEQSRQECIRKKLRYTRKSGEIVIISDIFSKVVKWIDLFKQIGDCVVQYDPGRAALPWAGVRFLLQIAVNGYDRFNFAVEGTALIAETICRYTVVEDLYLQLKSPATKELKRTLIKLYVAVIKFLSKTKSYFDQNSAKRILQSGLGSGPDLSRYISLIETQQVAVDACVNTVGLQHQINTHAELKHLLEEFDGPLNRMNDRLTNFEDNLEGTKRTEILRWISVEPYLQYHEQAKKDVLSGTGEWLLSDPVFQRWKKDSVSSIFWLHGIPGSGKSKSIVIEDAMKDFNNGYSPHPAFFYCSRTPNEPARSNPEAILASIVRQLSCHEPGQPLHDSVVTIYRKEEAKGFPSGALHIDASYALILQVVEQYPLTTIVIDALDECDPEKRSDLLEVLEKILQVSPNLIKVFVSSRDDQDIVCHLKQYPDLGITSDRNGDDITRFVRHEVHELIRKRKLLRYSHSKEEMEKVIIDKVTEGSAGMFRWVSMQLQNLCLLKVDNDIHERLGRLPSKLENLYLEVYEQLWAKPGEAQQHLTKNVLSWLLCAQEILKLDDFLTAVSVTPRKQSDQVSKDQILDICCNLVIFDSTLDTFRFAHLSVREFLEKQTDFTDSNANCLAAETCLFRLINSAENQRARKFLDRMSCPRIEKLILPDGLQRYINIYWATHCQLAGSRRSDHVLQSLLSFFLEELYQESAFKFWTDRLRKSLYSHVRFKIRYKIETVWSSSNVPLSIICGYNFFEVVQKFVSQNVLEKISRIDGFTSAVSIAVEFGCLDVLKVMAAENLLEATGEIIEIAAAAGTENNKGVMKLLLEQGDEEILVTDEVLKMVAKNRYEGSEDMMVLLLEQRVPDLKITEEVLQAAAGNGKSMMAILIDEGGDEVEITEGVLKAAAGRYGGLDVMALLIERRSQEIKISNDVANAAAEGRKEVMELLLKDYGQEFEITEEMLKAAARNPRSGEVMTLLLEKYDQEIKITEEILKTAAGNPHHGGKIMTALLEKHSQETDITEEILRTAVGNTRGGEEVMTLLLNVYAKDIKISEDVFKEAVGNKYAGKEIVGLILNQQDQEVKITKAIFRAAIENEICGKKVIDLLLNVWASRKMDKKWTSCVSNEDFTAILHAATLVDNKILVKNMITGGFDINIVLEESGTALHVAVFEGNESMVQILLNNGANVDIVDSHGWNPCTIAQVYGKSLINRIISNHCIETRGCEASKTMGFSPGRLYKVASLCKVTILEDGYTAMADLQHDSITQLRSNHPIPATNQLYYFEVTILNEGTRSIIGIGICEGTSRRTEVMPGWSNGSWAYHGDDGRIFKEASHAPRQYSSMHGVTDDPSYGPTYGTGDVIGCGTKLETGDVFFTKNGENLGIAVTNIRGRLFPVVGIGCAGVRVWINFGQSEFVYKDN